MLRKRQPVRGLRSAPTSQVDGEGLVPPANRILSNFLKVDTNTGLTFSGLALQTGDPEKRWRNRRSARRAYDTVMGMIDRVSLTDEDAQKLGRNLERLKSELISLGEEL